MGVYYTSAGLRLLLSELVTPGIPVGKDATTTIGSSVLSITNTSGLVVGQTIIGVGVPTRSKIISIVPSTSVTIDKTATAAGTVPIVGYDPFISNLDVRLITAAPGFSPTMTWAGFAEATYDGYSSHQAVAWSTILTSGDYTVAALECINFTPTDYVVPNTIIGLVWTWNTGSTPDINLLAAELFAVPVVLAAAGDSLNVTPILILASNLTAGPGSPMIGAS